MLKYKFEKKTAFIADFTYIGKIFPSIADFSYMWKHIPYLIGRI